MNDHDNEDLLALYRRSRQEQPSELVDRRIRQAALNASRKTQPNWLWGLSKVAVVVLSFSVVLQLWLDNQLPEDVVIEREQGLDDRPMAVLPERSVELPAQEAPPASIAADLSVRQKSTLEETASPGGASGSTQSSAPTTNRLAVSPEPLESISADEALLADSPSVFSEFVASIPLPVPELPTNSQELSQLAPQLTVERDPSGLLTVNDDNTLILSMSETADGFVFKAWPDSVVMGIDFPWDIQPENFADCMQEADNLVCNIGEELTGYFEGQRLDHIEWKQP